MASVLFSTIGQAVGGPFAAGIGATVGASLDSALARRGGADDSYVQQSAYAYTYHGIFDLSLRAQKIVQHEVRLEICRCSARIPSDMWRTGGNRKRRNDYIGVDKPHE